jgi:nitrogen fixation/metabolism regulation signal transduction histidine kinase
MDCSEAVAPLEAIGSQIAVFTSLLILTALLLALLVARALVRPLRELELAADRISKGDFDVEIDVRSNDEVGDLADSFERMVAAIKFFREHSRTEAEDADEIREPAADVSPELPHTREPT